MIFTRPFGGLRSELDLGTWGQTRYRFRVRELGQDYNKPAIHIVMSKFATDVERVAVQHVARNDFAGLLVPKVHTCFSRSQWQHLQGHICLSLSTDTLQSKSAPQIGHGLQRLSKLMRDAKCAHDLAGYTVPSSCVWVSAADAAWKNRPYGTTSSGRLVGRGRVVSVLTWKSRNIRRVVRSSLGAGGAPRS